MGGGARCNYMHKLISCHNAVVSINNFGIDRLMSQIALQIITWQSKTKDLLVDFCSLGKFWVLYNLKIFHSTINIQIVERSIFKSNLKY